MKEAQRNLDQKSLKATILDEELERLQVLLRQLVEKRLEKIQTAAERKQQVPVDLSEKWVLDQFAGIARHVDRFQDDLAQGREPTTTPITREASLLVRFVKDVPSIIGVDLKTRGPFLKEDVASLPFENAEGLIRQGAAVEIRVNVRENG